MTFLKKNILVICHDAQLYGSQQSLLLWLSGFAALGESSPWRFFVSVARPGPLTEKLASLPNVTLLTHRRLQWFKHDRRNPLQQLGDLLALILSAWPRAAAMAGIIRRHDIHLVHTNSAVSLEGALGAGLAGVPHIWHIRERIAGDNPKLMPTLGAALTLKLIRRLSAAILCISQAVATPLGSCNKIRVLYNAVPTPATMPATQTAPHRRPDSPPFTLGFAGRLSEGKRLHVLLAALARLLGTHPDLRLKVAGDFVDTPYRKRIESLMQHPGLTGAVDYLGFQADLAGFYAETDLLVVPSAHEPFGRVVIEAMAHQVLCLASDSGGIPEIITDGETGFLAPVDDPDQLASIIETIKVTADKTPARLETIRQNALRMIRDRFTLEAQVNAIDRCYQSLC
ncbi:MAG: glycosyltransferase family 4 protein [Candidatus Melainabacteria bacterium]